MSTALESLIISLFAIQIGDWDVSRVPDFSYLFLDENNFSFYGADAFNEPIDWNTGL